MFLCNLHVSLLRVMFVCFAGAWRDGEVFALVGRFCTEDFVLHRRLLRCRFHVKSLKHGEQVALHYFSSTVPLKPTMRALEQARFFDPTNVGQDMALDVAKLVSCHCVAFLLLCFN